MAKLKMKTTSIDTEKTSTQELGKTKTVASFDETLAQQLDSAVRAVNALTNRRYVDTIYVQEISMFEILAG